MGDEANFQNPHEPIFQVQRAGGSGRRSQWIMMDVTEPAVFASRAIAIPKKLVRQMMSLAQPRLVLLMLLAGCSVGPDFKVPDAPDVPLTASPLPDRIVADGAVQHFVHGRDLRSDWWTLFRSKELTELVDRALRNNHDLKSAQAALRVARANYEAQKGALFPLIGVGETSSRQKVATADLAAPTVSGDPYFTLHTAQLTISYVPDVFGGIRRQVEAASAQAESQRFMLEATYLTLTTNIALAAIQEASLNAQIEETRKAVDAEALLASGESYASSFESASARDWAALRSAKAQAEQTLPLLRKQLAAQEDLLAALTGEFAGVGQGVRFAGGLRLPTELPLVLSSQLVAQRPDVRAAQANLHAASALVGVAIANRIPLFNITGNIGRTSSQFDNLANPAPQFLFWTIAGSVTQTVFDGFTLEQRQRAAEAGLEQAMEQYRSTVITAFQNVADVLQAIALDGESVTKAQEASKAARENLCLTVAGFAGYSGEFDAGDIKDLKNVNDDQHEQQVIADAFRRWWGSVCRPNLKFENDLRKKLLEEARSSKKAPAKPDCPLPSKDKSEQSAVTCPDTGSAPSGIDVVTSEQLYLSTQLTLVTARATRYMDAVALFQALGGGWWNRAEVEEPGARAMEAVVRPPPPRL